MIQLGSVLKPADNSGARRLRVIGGFGGTGCKVAGIGKIVNAVVDRADPHGAVKDREKVKVVIVRTKKETRRPDGSYVRFDDNAGVVVNKENLPRGSRIFGPVAREVKDSGFSKIASLAAEVL